MTLPNTSTVVAFCQNFVFYSKGAVSVNLRVAVLNMRDYEVLSDVYWEPSPPNNSTLISLIPHTPKLLLNWSCRSRLVWISAHLGWLMPVSSVSIWESWMFQPPNTYNALLVNKQHLLLFCFCVDLGLSTTGFVLPGISYKFGHGQ